MANSFSKEERVAFEDVLEAFDESLVMSKNVTVYNPGLGNSSRSMERANNEIWRPMPYISASVDGTPGLDITDKFTGMTQLSVPVTLGHARAVPFTLNAYELRDAIQEKRLGDAARQKLAADINSSVVQVAAAFASIVVAQPGEPSGYTDVAECDAAFNEQGVPMYERNAAFGSRSYNGLSADLALRQTVTGKVATAYERSYIGIVAGFETYKMDYSTRLAGNPSTGARINGANQSNIPQSTIAGVFSSRNNVDNRFMGLDVEFAQAGTFHVGDCFTIANVYAVHHITKTPTNTLKTFRVVGAHKNAGTGNQWHLTITPAIVFPLEDKPSTHEYQNVSAIPADSAPITILNKNSAECNIFWQRESILLVPGSYAVPTGAGVDVIRGSTDQGIELVMQKFYDINTATTKYRLDTLYGVANVQPEMSGILLFGQGASSEGATSLSPRTNK